MKYVILSVARTMLYDNAAWYRPNRAGYTCFLDYAGAYTKAEADAICVPSRGENVAIEIGKARAMSMAVVDSTRALESLK